MEEDDCETGDCPLVEFVFDGGDGVEDPLADVRVERLVGGGVVEAGAEEGVGRVEVPVVADGVDVGGEEVGEGGEGGVEGGGHGGGVVECGAWCGGGMGREVTAVGGCRGWLPGRWGRWGYGCVLGGAVLCSAVCVACGYGGGGKVGGEGAAVGAEGRRGRRMVR